MARKVMLEEPAFFTHGLPSPTCRLESGHRIRFHNYQFETKDPDTVAAIRKSRLYNGSIKERSFNPMEAARNRVKRESELKEEIRRLKAAISDTEMKNAPIIDVDPEDAMKELAEVEAAKVEPVAVVEEVVAPPVEAAPKPKKKATRAKKSAPKKRGRPRKVTVGEK